MDDKLLKKIKLLLIDYPEAEEFLARYNKYVHLIDDLIDEPKNPELILQTTDLAADIFSSPFYIANKSVLCPVEKMINNSYADSVAWERSGVDWKMEASKTLRHAGLDMFYIVILLVAGREALREISLEKREFTFLAHLNDQTELGLQNVS